jgi:hypothetical protein
LQKYSNRRKKEEGRRKKEEGRGKREEGRRKKELPITFCQHSLNPINYQLPTTNY